MKSFIFISFLALMFNSCDPVYTLRLNDEKKLRLDTCGGIEISCKGLRGLHRFFRVKPLSNSMTINLSEFSERLASNNPENEIMVSRVSIDKSVIEKKGSILVNKGETLEIYLIISNPMQQIIIPSEKYITCNGKPIFTDTLRIE